MFYIGAGTSGRLGVTDASELPPTYGVPFGRVIGLIAGGDGALRRAVEHAEDDWHGAWRDMAPYCPDAGDVLIGIAASGTTPYVVGGLREARRHGLLTGAVTCNPASPAAAEAEFALEAVVGPEFVTGSTRMKAGTAQKLMLNMLSTAVMIRLGRVEGNRMVHMQLTNDKLVARGTRMVAEATGVPEAEARELLLRCGSVKRAVERWRAASRSDAGNLPASVSAAVPGDRVADCSDGADCPGNASGSAAVPTNIPADSSANTVGSGYASVPVAAAVSGDRVADCSDGGNGSDSAVSGKTGSAASESVPH